VRFSTEVPDIAASYGDGPQAIATAMVEAVDTVGVEARADRTRIAEGARVY
jgi:hypothetical protein